MKTKKGEKIDIKHNFKEYLSYLKKYKLLIFFLIFVISLNGIKQIADKYFFKVIIDKGTDFSAGNLDSVSF